MNTKTAIFILVIAAVAVGAFFLLRSPAEAPGNSEEAVSDILAEENAVVALDQQPGGTVTVEQAHLEEPGFVVVHEEDNGVPGVILGASTLLEAGRSDEVAVILSRPAREGETLYAMLHTDVDGDGEFNATVDTPVLSSLGGAITSSFTVSAQAEEDVEINL